MLPGCTECSLNAPGLTIIGCNLAALTLLLGDVAELARARRRLSDHTVRLSCRSRPEEQPMRSPESSRIGCSRKWNQPVVIENRTGAAGNIGSEQVYHSPPMATPCFRHHRRRL